MNIFRDAARNVSIVAGSHGVMWIATLLFTIAQARLLGPARFGELSLALAYSVFLTSVIDFGLGIQLSRLVAQGAGGVEALGATILLRAGLWTLLMPWLFLATILFGYDAELQLTIIVLALSVLFVGINTSIEAFLRGNERFFLPSLASLLYRVTAAAVGIALLLLGQPLPVVGAAFLAGTLVNLAVLLAGLRAPRRAGSPVDPRLAWRLFRAAIPLGLWWSIAAFCFSTDMVIMELRAPAANVGWYAAALRLFSVATIFPSIAVGMVLSPVLARLSLGRREDLRAVLEKAIGVLLLTGVAVSLVLVLFADDIIHLVYPAESFDGAAGALRLLAPRVLFLYVNTALLYTLIALHQERRLLLMVVTFAIVTPAANFVAIPLLQQDGAALVSSATEMGWLAWMVAVMPKDLLSLASARLALRAGMAALVAAVAGTVLLDRGLFVAAPVTLAIYGAAAFALGAVSRSDASALRGLVRRADDHTERTTPAVVAAGEEVA